MIGRLKSVLCAAAMIGTPGAAQATKLVTFTFTANGTGEWAGYNADWTNFSRPVSGATLAFTVLMGDTDNGGGGGGADTSYGVGATTTGVGFSSRAGSGYGGLTSSGLACFANPTATLSYGAMPVDPGCGTVTFVDQYRYGYLKFTGRIDGLTITEGGTGTGVSVVPFVPEPKPWALMLTGFALVGYVLRRRAARIACAI